MNNCMLIILSAPSGTGKNTVIRHLVKTHSCYEHAISTTTRPIRENEQSGVDYYFVNRLEFIQMIQKKEFLEWAPVLDNYYGTTIDEIDRIKRHNKIPILDIDVQGALQIKKALKDAVSIFLSPPSLEELKKRLEARGTETPEQIRDRLELAAEELKYTTDYDYHVVNREINKTAEQIHEIIQNIHE